MKEDLGSLFDLTVRCSARLCLGEREVDSTCSKERADKKKLNLSLFPSSNKRRTRCAIPPPATGLALCLVAPL